MEPYTLAQRAWRDVGTFVGVGAGLLVCALVALRALASAGPRPGSTMFEYCLQRASDARPDGFAGEAVSVVGSWGAFPLGVTCEWHSERSVWTQGPGWATSGAVLLVILVAVASVVVLRRSSSSRSG